MIYIFGTGVCVRIVGIGSMNETRCCDGGSTKKFLLRVVGGGGCNFVTFLVFVTGWNGHRFSFSFICIHYQLFFLSFWLLVMSGELIEINRVKRLMVFVESCRWKMDERRKIDEDDDDE